MHKYFTIGLLMFTTLSAQAALFCVESATELQDALFTAAGNSENDEIRIKSGDYSTSGPVSFLYSPTQSETLEISGGWFDFNQLGCFSQTSNPEDTTLDADNASTVMFFGYDDDADFRLSISNLTIANGFSETSNGAGIQIALPKEVIIERVMFIGNHGAQIGALKINGGDTIHIRNNVFLFNESDDGQGAVRISLDESANGLYFVNNTMMWNTHNVAQPVATTSSGLRISLADDGMGQQSRAMIINNLFWDNEDNDLFTSSAGTHYIYNNNYEQRGGDADFESSNISLPPQLAPPILDFTPEPGSPLINRGRSMPEIIPIPTPFNLGWDHGDQDFDGFLGRVIDGRVDIGALEAPPEVAFFVDGFGD